MFRDFPLPSHGRAQPAAEAAQCANAQGKFWEYHDAIFDNQRKLEQENLRQFAVDLELDTEAFNTCLDEGEFRKDVVQDHAEGTQAGVTGTPAFFINGRFISGAQPFEAFEKIIEDELAR